MERALETLGGTQDIAKARESQSNKLELHFPPRRSVLTSCKWDIKDEGRISEGAEENVCADIVGHVSETYNFNGMADYQHVLAVHADVARKKKRNWADVEPQFGSRNMG
ncbi:putative transcription factor IIIC subunit Tfc1/Sfc1 [Helianthus annuus]|nr:putative transcription factor IIIC subunit Tfc1/Sfc1 [Helianthus annuus]